MTINHPVINRKYIRHVVTYTDYNSGFIERHLSILIKSWIHEVIFIYGVYAHVACSVLATRKQSQTVFKSVTYSPVHFMCCFEFLTVDEQTFPQR
jgi:hypothetical protein